MQTHGIEVDNQCSAWNLRIAVGGFAEISFIQELCSALNCDVFHLQCNGSLPLLHHIYLSIPNVWLQLFLWIVFHSLILSQQNMYNKQHSTPFAPHSIDVLCSSLFYSDVVIDVVLCCGK